MTKGKEGGALLLEKERLTVVTRIQLPGYRLGHFGVRLFDVGQGSPVQVGSSANRARRVAQVEGETAVRGIDAAFLALVFRFDIFVHGIDRFQQLALGLFEVAKFVWF